MKKLFWILIITILFLESKAQLKVSLIKEIPKQNILTFYDGKDMGSGNTSIDFDSEIIIKSSKLKSGDSFGYFDKNGNEISYVKRNRDLGQTFKIEGNESKILKKIIVSTNHGTNAVRQNMYGQKISVQIFEVIGTPKLNKNGTDTTEALHGFPHDRVGQKISAERDDYFEGEFYKNITVLRNGVFPSKKEFGVNENEEVSPNHPNLKGRLLEFSFEQPTLIELKPKVTYAFLIMVDELGDRRGFALANNYYGKYPNGHGIRRDGNGNFPPIPYDISAFNDSKTNKKAIDSARFPSDFKKRIKIQPGTNGYPDVCTYRDLYFYVIGE
jgi:uncharacterized protein (DUF2141 family)